MEVECMYTLLCSSGKENILVQVIARRIIYIHVLLDVVNS